MFVFASFWNSFANFLPKCFDKFYTSSGLNDKLSRLPGDLLLPEGVRTSAYLYFSAMIKKSYPIQISLIIETIVLIITQAKTAEKR